MEVWVPCRLLALAALVLSPAVVLSRPGAGAELPLPSGRDDGAPFWSSAFFHLDFGDGHPGGARRGAEAELAATVQSADDESVTRYARSLALAMSRELSAAEAFSLAAEEVALLRGAVEIDLSGERDWHQTGVFRFHGRIVEGSGCILFFDPRSGRLLGRHVSRFEEGDFDGGPPSVVIPAEAARAAAEAVGACESDRSTRVREPVYSTRLRRFVFPVVAAVEPHRIDSRRAGDAGYLDTLTYRIDSETGAVLDVERFHLHGEVSGRTFARQPQDRRGTSFFSERVERPVPQVSLRYEHPALDAPVEAVSGDDGRYLFVDVPDAGTIVAVTQDEELLLIKQVAGGGREDPEMARVRVPGAAVPGARVTLDLDLTAPEGTRDRLARTGIWTALKKATAFDRRLRPQHPGVRRGLRNDGSGLLRGTF